MSEKETKTESIYTESNNLRISDKNLQVEAVEWIRGQLSSWFSDIIDSINEVRTEVGQFLRETSVETHLQEARNYLSTYTEGTAFHELAVAAINGLEVGFAWLNSEQDIRLFDMVVDLVSFGLCVRDYLEKGHFVGDFEKIATKVIDLVQQRVLGGSSPLLGKG